MAAVLTTVWTPLQIAEITQTSIKDVIAELEAGRIRSFRIGGEYRVTDSAFQAFMAGQFSSGTETAIPKSGQLAVPRPATGTAVMWKPRGEFTYTWPDGKQDAHTTAYEAEVPLSSGRHFFVIGYTRREAAGMKDRCRVTVFLGQVPHVVPVVEFAGANDFATTRQLASIIKDSSNKHVRSQSQLPLEYQGIPTGIYSDVVAGPYAARSLAVLADNDDRDLMLRHAIIRATYKGMIRG